MTVRFLVDEDLPRSTARALSAAGYSVLDVRDVGLRGAKDTEVGSVKVTGRSPREHPQ
ncbi:MAG: DUF5615 family PIN-like protein [Clostridia bacterium]|nr:DUF5615 family PIN-like protein [Clostridia bacterium]